MRTKAIFDGSYVIYEDGRIYSNKVHRFLKIGMNTKGYPHVQVVVKGKGTTYLLHTLLYRAFTGETPEGFEVDHIDGVRSNFQLGNLQLLSLSDNRKKSYTQGRNVVGDRNANSKLTELDVIEIRKLNAKCYSKVAIAKRYGVTPATVGDICSRKRWAHVP